MHAAHLVSGAREPWAQRLGGCCGAGRTRCAGMSDSRIRASAPSRAATILSGLGFDPKMQLKATQEFSGGWRMRIALAQALFMAPDLLLDEPTNHLDVHALTWLEEFLLRWEKTVVIVSHDRGFLNATTTTTIFLHRKRLAYYGGSYDTFLKVRGVHRANDPNLPQLQSLDSRTLKNTL